MQRAAVWYNKILEKTFCRENDFMLTITLLGTAATMPLPDRALSAALLAALVLLGGFSVTAYAGGGEDIPTAFAACCWTAARARRRRRTKQAST